MYLLFFFCSSIFISPVTFWKSLRERSKSQWAGFEFSFTVSKMNRSAFRVELVRYSRPPLLFLTRKLRGGPHLPARARRQDPSGLLGANLQQLLTLQWQRRIKYLSAKAAKTRMPLLLTSCFISSTNCKEKSWLHLLDP